uniref:Uncharacterized protein n=1 Tax=viral metagenome TaxID=1070528 RepID=A0A6C0JJZ0_9ZZZZ
MESQPFVLYYLELENQKLFLFTFPETSDMLINENDNSATIMLQCQLLFDFVKKNPPLGIVHKVTVHDFCEVDCYVKKNMKQYGLENVRGGTYSMEVIPDTLLEALRLELSDSIRLSTQQLIINNLFKKYKDDKSVSIDEIKNKIDEYNEILKKRHDLCGGLERTFLTELEWIRNFVPNSHGKISTFDRQKYKDILLKMKCLNANFSQQKDGFQDIAQLKYPEFVLDTLFFHSHHLKTNLNLRKKYEIEKENLLSKFEYMAYWMINRAEEYEFDLTTI